MANIQLLKGVSSVTRDTADGGFMPVRGTRDGALYSADWYDALALEGRVFTVNGGSASTPATWAGAYDADTPDLTIDIPDGTIAIPIGLQVHFETGSTGIAEVIGLVSSTITAPSAYTGGAVVYAKNLRVDQPIKSVASCVSAVDANSCTDPHSGDYFEFYRSGYPTNPVVAGSPSVDFRWSARNYGPPPIVVDGGSIVVYANMAGATATGFIIVTWVELPESFIK